MPGVLGDPEPRKRGALGGIGAALAQLFGGAHDPRLSEEQNKQAQRQAMMQAGLMTLMHSGPGTSPLQSIAAGAMMGQQAGGAARQGVVRQQAAQALQQQFGGAGADPQKLQQLVLQLVLSGDMEGARALVELLKSMPGGADLMSVAPGSTVFDPSSRTPVFTAPERAGGTDLPGDLDAILWASGTDSANMTPEQRAAALDKYEEFRRAGAMQVHIGRERQEERGLTQIDLDRFEEIDKVATEAENRMDSLTAMEVLLDQGMTSGRLDELTLPARNLAASFGVGNTEKLGRQEVFRALANKIALEMKGNMTGQMSDRDIIFLQNQAPQLGNTAAGNRLLIEILRRVAHKQVELADEADRYRREHGNLLGWRTHRRQWLRTNQIDLSDLREAAEGPAPPWERR